MNKRMEPCPFCGRMPSLIKTTHQYLSGVSERGNDSEIGYSVQCDEYACLYNPGTAEYDTADLAIKCWNWRGKAGIEKFRNEEIRHMNGGKK